MKLKDFFINGEIVGSGGSSLPPFITLIQYHNTWGEDHTKKWPNGNPNDWESVDDHGTMGNSYYAYSVDCKHKFLKPFGSKDIDPVLCETESFQWLNDIFLELRMPIVKKSELENRFHIIEIPDYGHQAMSEFYRDFIVLVYNTYGAKIPQKYIGIIRSYINKTAYILIDKSIDNLTYLTLNADGEIVNNFFSIKIVFKNNVEEKTEKSISLELDKTRSFESKYLTFSSGENLKKEDIDFGEIDDYVLYMYADVYDGNGELKNKGASVICNNIYNTDFIRSVHIEKTSRNNIAGTSTQTANDLSEVRDYFKQAFEYDYLENTNEVYTRESSDNSIEIVIETNIPTDASETLYKNISLSLSKHSKYYDFIVFKEKFSLSDYFGSRKYPHDISVYKMISGEKQVISRNIDNHQCNLYINFSDNSINSTELTKDVYYELIPEFRNIQKIQMIDSVKSVSGSNLVTRKGIAKTALLAHNHINDNDKIIDSSSVEVFKNGYLMSNDNLNVMTNDILETIIYSYTSNGNWGNVLESSIEVTPCSYDDHLERVINDDINTCLPDILFDKKRYWYDSDDIEFTPNTVIPVYTLGITSGDACELMTDSLIKSENRYFSIEFNKLKNKDIELIKSVKDEEQIEIISKSIASLYNSQKISDINVIRRRILNQLSKKTLIEGKQPITNFKVPSINDYLVVKFPTLTPLKNFNIDLSGYTEHFESTSELKTGVINYTDSDNNITIDIDATDGKWANNGGGWIQVNSGTVFTLHGVPYPERSNISLTIYDSEDYITISRSGEDFICRVENNTYIKDISVEYHSPYVPIPIFIEVIANYAGIFQEYHNLIAHDGVYSTVIIPYWRFLGYGDSDKLDINIYMFDNSFHKYLVDPSNYKFYYESEPRG